MEHKQIDSLPMKTQDEIISVAPLNPRSTNGAQKSDNQKVETENLTSGEDSKSVTVFKDD